MNWNEYFIKVAYAVALKSKDPKQVGCILVDRHNHIRATGFNGFPKGVNDAKHRYDNNALKLNLTVHAEANTIACAARVGVPLADCTLVTTKFPCTSCAGLIIQSGITRVLTPRIKAGSKWTDSNVHALGQFNECGVEVEYYES